MPTRQPPSSTLTLAIAIALLLSASAPSLAASLGTDEDSLVDRLAAEHARKAALDGGGLQLRAREDDRPAAGEGGNATAATGTTSVPLAAPPKHHPDNGDFVFYVIVGTTTGLGLLLIIVCAIFWFKYSAGPKRAEDEIVDADFAQQSGGVSGGVHGHPGDGKLALSAQMYHYQHQKQQMMALEKSNSDSKQGASDTDSDAENEDADFAVYECPGLASTGEMEVRNPLFKEEFDSPAAASSASPAASGRSSDPPAGK